MVRTSASPTMLVRFQHTFCRLQVFQTGRTLVGIQSSEMWRLGNKLDDTNTAHYFKRVVRLMDRTAIYCNALVPERTSNA